MQQEGASVGVMDITSSYDINKCFIRIIESITLMMMMIMMDGWTMKHRKDDRRE